MASKIDPGQAQSLIQEYRNQNKEAGEHALKTPEGQHLNGFFLNRESLENILKDPKVDGIHVHLAKHPDFAGKPDKVCTMVYSGSVATQTGSVKPYESTGDTYSSPPPCPPYCS
ncbi:MAG: hypothetical protein ACTHJ8_14160 [Mucilaginibacter sp.]|jgi:hypothetical protein